MVRWPARPDGQVADRGRGRGEHADERSEHRVVPVQVGEVGDDRLLGGRFGTGELGLVVRARAAVDLRVPLGVAPAQFGREGVAGQVVRVQAARAELHDGQSP